MLTKDQFEYLANLSTVKNHLEKLFNNSKVFTTKKHDASIAQAAMKALDEEFRAVIIEEFKAGIAPSSNLLAQSPAETVPAPAAPEPKLQKGVITRK